MKYIVRGYVTAGLVVERELDADDEAEAVVDFVYLVANELKKRVKDVTVTAIAEDEDELEQN